MGTVITVGAVEGKRAAGMRMIPKPTRSWGRRRRGVGRHWMGEYHP
jgi:hypothetical protein